MIRSLHISGFKVFGDFTLPELGRLNLFVGENNTGKSCLLEAIGLYAGRTPNRDVLQTAAGRSAGNLEAWESEGTNEEFSSVRHPVFDLFHRSGTSNAAPIIIGKIGDSSPLRLEFRWHHRTTDDDGFIRYVPASPGDLAGEALEMVVTVHKGEKQVALITRRMLPLRSKISDAEKLFNEDASAVAHLPANGFSDDKAATMWDAVVQGPGQQVVLDWLRMLEPKIKDLVYIGERRQQRSRTALLKLENEGRIPLRSMGDGLTRIFHMALAIASAPRGILLIDEFENGLHWRVQEKLWLTLSDVAQRFKVQIFSTTHSRDCIESFTAAGKKLASGDAKIYRLERTGENVFASDLPLINVDAAMREHEEVR